jgi:HEAT repeat protein
LLLASVGKQELLITTDRDGVWLGETAVPADYPGAKELHALLRSHHVGQIRLPPAVMSSSLLALVRVLAAPEGAYADINHLIARLDAAGGGIIQVSPPALEATSAQAGVPEVAPNSGGGTGAGAPPAVAPSVPPRKSGKTGETDALQELGPDAMSEQKVGMMHFLTLERKAVSGLDDIVHRLEASSPKEDVTDLLNELVIAGDRAAKDKDFVGLLSAATALIRMEAQGGPAAEHRSYGIALRRMLPRSAIEPLAKLAASGPHRTEAVAVLQRMGADATEVLLQRMANAESAAERRGYYSALTQMTEGTGLLVHMLSHDEWYVVRNVAEICGELRLESAIPGLTKRIHHEDERVRRSVAGALARIGSATVIEPLRQALKDPSPMVRLEVAQGIEGRKLRALAMPLAVAVDEEGKPDVLCEMLLALGRIGTPEAVQAISKAGEPGGKILRRKPLAVRLAAVQALGLAGAPAVGHLRHLLKDSVGEVREAAQRALATLSEQPES